MSGDFLDTNILVTATLGTGPRSETARTLVAAGGILSVQVLNEFANLAHRKFKRTWPEIRSALSAFRTLCPDIRPVTVATHAAALEIAARDGLSFYDALIVASALEAGCTTLFSEDLQDTRIIAGRLTILNPFRSRTRPP